MRLGAEKRTCEIKRNFIFQPSKILIEKEQKNAKKLEIKKYITKENYTTEKSEEILNDVSNFYKQLLGCDRIEKE